MLNNEFVTIGFHSSGSDCGVASILNHRTGRVVRFTPNAPFVTIGDVVYDTAELAWTVGERQEELSRSMRAALVRDGHDLALIWTCRLDEYVASWQLEIVNNGTDAVVIRHIDLLDASADAAMKPFTQRIDLALGEADWMEEDDANGTVGYPVSIDNHLFVGIDWPVADNKVSGEGLRCRQYCAETLQPGATFRSRTLSIGACEEGQVMRQFLAHMERLRGRETRRASFYFSWLTHSWEGLEDRELEVGLTFFERLRKTFDIRFDIYAVDAGIVETNNYYYEPYRLTHDRLFPNGLKPHAEKAQEIGMDFGIWLGPGGFGEDGGLTEERIETVVSMVREWNVALIKMDTAVSQLLGNDPYKNEHAMRRLERLVRECREVRPDLIIINHRVSYSPYILMLLDSTLWESRETYPDVHMINNDRPRLMTRNAQHGFGEPAYFGVYSELLEDHGVCLSGERTGWADEFVIQAFGRALMLSPEVYGTLFLLRDEDYPAFGRLMRLAESFRPVLRHTVFDRNRNTFIHSDGERALLCIINDSWERTSRSFAVHEDLGLSADTEAWEIRIHHPRVREDGQPDIILSRGEQLRVDLHPFAVVLVEAAPGAAMKEPLPVQEGATLSSLPPERMEHSSIALGALDREEASAEQAGIAERIKFAISSDPTEEQTLRSTEPSAYPEITAARNIFRDKIKKQHGIASNAWDGDPGTAWGDAWHWKYHDNVWRIDLGQPQQVSRIEVKLSILSPGPVFEEEAGRKLDPSPIFEVSHDGVEWVSAAAAVFKERQPFMRSYTALIAAEFPELAAKVRYVRMKMSGLLVEDIRIKVKEDGRLVDADRTLWQGNNLLSARKPVSLFRKSFQVGQAGEGTYAAVICRLPDEVRVPLLQEVAVCWLRTEEGDILPFTEASPVYPFHGWEWNTHHLGNAWVFRHPVDDSLAGRKLELCAAWYGPAFGEGKPDVAILPVVEGYVVTVNA